jgi:hypothetical protein
MVKGGPEAKAKGLVNPGTGKGNRAWASLKEVVMRVALLFEAW